MLYVRLNKALYGCLRATIIFHHKLQKELTDYGFVINNYNPCVKNGLCKGVK